MIEIQQCLLCKSKTSIPLFTGQDRLYGYPESFTLVKCDRCGLIYLISRPDGQEIDRYYPQDYVSFPLAIEDEPSWFKRIDRRYGLHKRCREIIRRVKKPGRILDIGCATGIFLHGMQQRGWEAYGVEPSSYAAQYARSRFHLNVIEGTLDTARFEADYFDVVTLWDVLEHIPDPDQTLVEINRILKLGGWLVMSLPNPDSWESAWFSRYWAGWDIPRHFFIYSRNVIAKLLGNTGYSIQEVRSFSGRHGVLVLSLDFWMKDWNTSSQNKKRVSSIAKSIPARMLTYPFYSIADRLNKSSIMTVFARKV